MVFGMSDQTLPTQPTEAQLEAVRVVRGFYEGRKRERHETTKEDALATAQKALASAIAEDDLVVTQAYWLGVALSAINKWVDLIVDDAK